MKILSLVILLASCPLFGQSRDILDHVRVIRVDGRGYFSRTDFPRGNTEADLLRELADPKQERYWPNTVRALGFLGSDSSVPVLVRLLEKNPAGNLSSAHYRAKTSVPFALGCLANGNGVDGSQAALRYLLESLEPNAWKARGLSWRLSRKISTSTALDEHKHLTKVAILALGLTGRPEAKGALEPLLSSPDLKDVARTALNAHEVIASKGLAGYFRNERE